MRNAPSQMMRMHEKDMPMGGMNMALMEDCIEALSACEQACTMCAASLTGEGMEACMNLCQNTADMAHTMMRMMLRPAGMHMESMLASLQATMTLCAACADECMTHSEMHEDCAMCAEVCRQCAMACQKMMDSMSGAMS